jgi:hypothetical protein
LLILDLDKINDSDPKVKYAAAFATTLHDPLWTQADLYPLRQDHELAFREVFTPSAWIPNLKAT